MKSRRKTGIWLGIGMMAVAAAALLGCPPSPLFVTSGGQEMPLDITINGTGSGFVASSSQAAAVRLQ